MVHVMTRPDRRLSRESWIDAALVALTERGVAGVAVEPLATRLGVTKGSFYWHFANRDELLAAALEAWEAERTDELIARLDEVPDPRDRLAVWAQHALGADKALLVGLHAASDHPIVGPVLRRVTERRIEYLAELFRAAGASDADAGRRALLLYGADVGLFEVSRALGDQPDLDALIGTVQSVFLP
jgi:AcrR family transcriptional regulator